MKTSNHQLSSPRSTSRSPGLAVVALTGLLAPAALGATTTLYVDQTAAAGGLGGSWSDPIKSLAAALANAASLSAAGDDVILRVAEGTYRPDRGPGLTLGDRTLSFQLTNRVRIEGGYDAATGDRDPDAYPTVLSGDIGVIGTSTDNSEHVMTGFFAADAEIDGLAIVDGSVSGDGAGVSLTWSSATFTNVLFTNNYASRGGAVYALNSVTLFDDCAFDANFAGEGGAMHLYGNTATLTGCRFSENMSTPSDGGAVYAGNLTLVVTDTNFLDNESDAGGRGGAVFTDDMIEAEFQRCVFGRNTGDDGGAIYSRHTSTAADGDLLISRCTFEENRADSAGSGGAVYRESTSVYAHLMIASSTFVLNESLFFGGALRASGTTSLSNSIFERNDALLGSAIAQIDQDPIYSQLTIWSDSDVAPIWTAGDVTLTNSIVWNHGSANAITVSGSPFVEAIACDLQNSGGSSAWILSGVTDGGGNIDTDPLFLAPSGTFDLRGDSPCKDTGDTGWLHWDFPDLNDNLNTTEDLPFDIEEEDRVQGPAVDMGANEHVPGDVDGDGVADFDDLLEILANWGGIGSADLNGDGEIGFPDLLIVLANWNF